MPRTAVFELVRLFVFDGYGGNIESYLIGESFRWLKKNRPDIKALISYSDPMQGHVGTVYQAYSSSSIASITELSSSKNPTAGDQAETKFI